jgi:release factor glutamine methyltransferase
LLCRALGCTQTELLLSAKADSRAQSRFTELIDRRAAGEPVQYLLGEWEFCGLPFFVGEGVLIPRPETEILAEYAVTLLKGQAQPVAVDLCAGTGCIGLTIACRVPSAHVYLVEKSPAAFAYLERNRNRPGMVNTTLLQGDILTDALPEIPQCDVLCVNPPYIPADEMPTLQREVLREPAMALDGGADGLDFYRAIAKRWAPRVKPGGVILPELGDGQYDAVRRIFADIGCAVSAIPDNAGHLRVLVAKNHIKGESRICF